MSVIKILAQFETDMLKTKLRQAPEIIKEQKKTIRELRERFKTAEVDRSIAEANIVTDISAEVNPATGKAMFSNVEARNAELAKRKNNDSVYLAAAREAREAGYRLEESQDELEKLQDDYKSYRYITKLTTAELELFATSEGEAEEDDMRYTLTDKGIGKVSGQVY